MSDWFWSFVCRVRGHSRSFVQEHTGYYPEVGYYRRRVVSCSRCKDVVESSTTLPDEPWS